MEISTFEKNNDAYKRFLQDPWPKWRPVKGDQLANVHRVQFRSGLTYTPVKITIVFIIPQKL